MKKAIVDIPSADYGWFEKLMVQQGWIWEWANEGEEHPDYQDDDEGPSSEEIARNERRIGDGISHAHGR
jgi:endonuclease YncB( thermonuclease family)